MRWGILLFGLLLAACSTEETSSDALVSYVSRNAVGVGHDHWIEMQTMYGDWERTGLIFGYTDDYGECEKAIAGLKQVNYEREYRCVPAN